jgi:protein transport protein SEC24
MPSSGHGHSQSTAGFFSPAAPVDPNTGVGANGSLGSAGGQFFSPATGGPGGGGNEFVNPGAGASVPGGNAGVTAGGATGYGGGVQQMSNQFGQMGLGAGGNAQGGGVNPRTQANPATVDLIKTPLNPLELMTMEPPEIRLPPNVSLSVSSVH